MTCSCLLYTSYALQYYLYNMLSSTTTLKDLAAGATAQIDSMPGQSMKMAMAVIVTGPVLLFYPCLLYTSRCV